MKFLKWFLQFFEGPRAALPKTPRRVKFLEGTEWICPTCEKTIAIARCDIYGYELARFSHWDVKDPGFWTMTHCGAYAARFDELGRMQFFTPTGWVG